jgi:integrase
MAAAAALPSPVLPASMRTLIGLLASTGVRSGEALALDACDRDTGAQVLTVTGKYGRKRLIALHPSAAAALSDYLRFREQHAADGTAALLIGQAGRRLGRSVANPAFRSLATGCGLEPQPGCRSPRLHDFRLAFAVSTQRRGVASDASFRLRREDGPAGAADPVRPRAQPISNKNAQVRRPYEGEIAAGDSMCHRVLLHRKTA